MHRQCSMVLMEGILPLGWVTTIYLIFLEAAVWCVRLTEHAYALPGCTSSACGMCLYPVKHNSALKQCISNYKCFFDRVETIRRSRYLSRGGIIGGCCHVNLF